MIFGPIPGALPIVGATVWTTNDVVPPSAIYWARATMRAVNGGTIVDNNLGLMVAVEGFENGPSVFYDSGAQELQLWNRDENTILDSVPWDLRTAVQGAATVDLEINSPAQTLRWWINGTLISTQPDPTITGASGFVGIGQFYWSSLNPAVLQDVSATNGLHP